MRNLLRAMPLPLPDDLSLRYSHPEPIVRLFLAQFGREETERILQTDNEAPQTVLQVNPLRGNAAALLEELPGAQAHPWLPGCLTVSGPVEQTAAFREGRVYVQDAAAHLAVAVSGIEPGMRVLDCCAAPGGKSFAAALQMQNRGTLYSCDIHPHRLDLIERGAERLGISILETHLQDASQPVPAWRGAMDVVLADVPCSGLGVIRKKPDIRYHEPSAELPALQRAILAQQNRGLRSILGTLDYALPPSGKHYVISFHVDKVSLYLKSNQYTPFIVTGGLILSLCAVFFYSLFSSRIFKQVQSIKSGLEKIGDNNLHYRLPEAAYSGELGSISRSINKMSSKLETLIENEYLYQLRQKEAELAELQAKFDPHFLYNSLEIIRGRVYDSGDTETADVIKKLSQLFRSFINKKRFVTIQDELAFCSSYFSLFHSPSSDNLQVVYDVDSSLLFCGIIRNLLQPVIENYFVHGFDPSSSQNHIIIRCAENGPEYIKITIIDDGFGINANRLEEIRAAMNASDDSGKQSYGLKNLARRIQLFYGPAPDRCQRHRADK